MIFFLLEIHHLLTKMIDGTSKTQNIINRIGQLAQVSGAEPKGGGGQGPGPLVLP
jgi:hypothetical protein